jgi:hypothetical protein
LDRRTILILNNIAYDEGFEDGYNGHTMHIHYCKRTETQQYNHYLKGYERGCDYKNEDIDNG